MKSIRLIDGPDAMKPPSKSTLLPENAHPKRPFNVTLIVLGVLIIAVINLDRLVQSIQMWDFLAQLPGVSPFYIAVSGLWWTLTGFLLTVCLWRGMRIAYNLLPLAGVLFIMYTWLDSSLVGGQFDFVFDNATWPFKAGLSLLALVLLFWTLSSSKAKAYFGRNP
jgi:hypothetical protein